MARPRTGHLHKTKQGQWIVKFMLNGERFTEPLGHESELSQESLPHLRDALMRRVNNGEWTPKASAPRPVRARLRSEPTSTYRVFATLMFRQWCLEAGVRPEEAGDLRWKLSIFMDALGEHDLDAITERMIDLAKLELLAERAAVEQALHDGQPIMETAVGRGGRPYQRRKRGLDRNSINKGLKTVIRVLEAAKREGHIETVPRIASLKARRPRRSFLHPIQIRAFFEAGARLEQRHRGLDWDQVRYIRSSTKSSLALARELHVSDVLVGKVRRRELWNGEPGRRNRNDVPRVAILKALVLAGPRADELCGLNGHHVDLAGRRLRIHRQGRREELKSEAGFRVVPMLPALHECLIEHRAGWPYPPEGSAFATRTGRANTPNNILNRIVSPAHAEANLILAQWGEEPIAHLTPHSLRRTFASILATLDVGQKRARQLMGHEDYRTTADVHEQDIDDSATALGALETVMGCTLVEAYDTFAKRGVLHSFCTPDTKKPAEAGFPFSPES